MNTHEMIEDIQSKDQFLDFLSELKRDSAEGVGWENESIVTFLDGMRAWASESATRVPSQPTWRTFAEMLYAGKVYK